MTLERTIAQLFKMDDATWLRHANPCSEILGFTVLPILILAFWSRLWLGGWAVSYLLPSSSSGHGTIPRIFPATHSLDHWMSKGAMGERVWLNGDAVHVPAYHQIVPNVLSAVSVTSVLFIVWGV